MLDLDGFVAETNSTNVFIVDAKGTLLTPHATACLPGMCVVGRSGGSVVVCRSKITFDAHSTRNIVLEKVAPLIGVPTRETRLSLVDFYTANEVFKH